jgi:hypothetical protein
MLCLLTVQDSALFAALVRILHPAQRSASLPSKRGLCLSPLPLLHTGECAAGCAGAQRVNSHLLAVRQGPSRCAPGGGTAKASSVGHKPCNCQFCKYSNARMQHKCIVGWKLGFVFAVSERAS